MGLANLIKLLLIALAVWVLYRGIRTLLGGQSSGQGRRRANGKAAGAMEELVRDPACGTYVPKHQALRLWVKGKEEFFCSEKCRDLFLEGKTGSHEDCDTRG